MRAFKCLLQDQLRLVVPAENQSVEIAATALAMVATNVAYKTVRKVSQLLQIRLVVIRVHDDWRLLSLQKSSDRGLLVWLLRLDVDPIVIGPKRVELALREPDVLEGNFDFNLIHGGSDVSKRLGQSGEEPALSTF